MVPPKPDKILIVIDIHDPLTYDKDFTRSIKYSPYVIGASEFSDRNRRHIVQRDADEDEDLMANKFVIDIEVEKLGDFVGQYLANPDYQRSLTFLEYFVEDIDESEVPDSARELAEAHGLTLEEALEGGGDLVYVYQLSSGDKIDPDDEEEDMSSDKEDSPKAKVMLLPPQSDLGDDNQDDSDDQEEEIGDLQEDLEMSGQVFIGQGSKSIH